MKKNKKLYLHNYFTYVLYNKLDKKFNEVKYMKKSILTVMILMFGFSLFSFSAAKNEDHYQNRVEKQKKYDKICAKYDSKIESLNKKLSQKNDEIEKAVKSSDKKKVNKLMDERDSIKKELESVHSEFRKELAKNNLSDYR